MTAILGLKFKCQAAPVGRPKVLIVSHERSGTHFVMNSLALNFGYIASPWVNLDYELGINFHSPYAFDSLMSHFAGQWVANVFKSHHEFGFYADWIHKHLADFKIIYMLRDAASVLRSYQRFLQTTQWNEGPKISSPSKFIRANPVGSLTRFQFQYAETMTDRWCNHVEGWLRGGLSLGSSAFLPVLYSSLDESFEDSMKSIATFLNLKLPERIQKPDRFANVVYPSPPPAFRLEGFPLTKADLAFLEDTTSETDRLIREVLQLTESTVQTGRFVIS